MLISVQRHLHRTGKWILGLILVIMIISLLSWQKGIGPGQGGGSGRDFRVYGKTVSRSEFEHAKDAQAFALTLQMGQPVHRNQIDDRQVLATLALLEKARKLGIRVGDEEIAQRIRVMPVFQENGEFSENRLKSLLSNELMQRHLTEDDFRQIVADQIAVARMLELVSTTALVAPEEAQQRLNQMNEKTEIAVAKFDQKSFKAPEPTEEQLKKYYEENGDRFKVGRKVKVMYVEFPIPPAPKPAEPSDEELRAMFEQQHLVGRDGAPVPFDQIKPLLKKAVAQQKESIARQETADKAGRLATEFIVKFPATEGSKEIPDFRAIAQKEGLAVKETDFVGDPNDLKGMKNPIPLLREILKLSKDNPISQPISGDDAVYVAYWVDDHEAHIPDLKDVKSKVAQMWKTEWSLRQSQEAGKGARTKLEQLLAQKQAFEQASKAAGITWENLPAFTYRELKQNDPGAYYKKAAFGLPVGAVSEYLPDYNGGFFVYIKKREPASIAAVEQDLTRTMAALAQGTREIVVREFEQNVLREAGLMSIFEEIEKRSTPAE